MNHDKSEDERRRIKNSISSNDSLKLIIDQIEKSSLEKTEIKPLFGDKVKSKEDEYRKAFLQRLLDAVRQGDVSIVERLNSIKPFDINVQLEHSLSTLMHTAAYYGQTEIIKLFLNDPEFIPGVRDSTNHTPADLAYIGGASQEAIDLLTDVECRAFLRKLEANEQNGTSSQPKPKP